METDLLNKSIDGQKNFQVFSGSTLKLMALIGCCFFSSPVPILFAFLPIGMYNGKRGFIKGKAAQYLFYAAYPLHIMILYLIKERCFGY